MCWNGHEYWTSSNYRTRRSHALVVFGSSVHRTDKRKPLSSILWFYTYDVSSVEEEGRLPVTIQYCTTADILVLDLSIVLLLLTFHLPYIPEIRIENLLLPTQRK